MVEQRHRTPGRRQRRLQQFGGLQNEPPAQQPAQITETTLLHESDPDFQQTNLTLMGRPKSDKLLVFIRDPENPELYRVRRIGLRPSTIVGSGLKPIEFDTYSDQLYEKPIDGEGLEPYLLEIARNNKLPHDLGMAEYSGSNKISLDRILRIVATRYSLLRDASAILPPQP